MFKVGIIEESLKNRKILERVKPYFISQRLENVPEEEYPIWHTNEYHIPAEKIDELLADLKEAVKLTWYIHAFSNSKLYVALPSKVFVISLQRDNTWNEMIEYGVTVANVERKYLEKIPLYV